MLTRAAKTRTPGERNPGTRRQQAKPQKPSPIARPVHDATQALCIHPHTSSRRAGPTKTTLSPHALPAHRQSQPEAHARWPRDQTSMRDLPAQHQASITTTPRQCGHGSPCTVSHPPIGHQVMRPHSSPMATSHVAIIRSISPSHGHSAHAQEDDGQEGPAMARPRHEARADLGPTNSPPLHTPPYTPPLHSPQDGHETSRPGSR